MRTTSLILAAVAAALAAPGAHGQGSVKSQVVWSDKAIPKNEEAKVNVNQAVCLAKGKIYQDRLLIDPKTKGVKNVVFWLVDAKNPLGTLPTPRALQGKLVEIDQPCCTFIPRHTVILDGQKLVVKNTAPIAHNVSINGGPLGPNVNVLIAPGGRHDEGKVTPRAFPIVPFSCGIHPWMRGYLLALPSPYHAVTDAEGKFEIKNVPAGDYRLVGWHEEIGWIFPAARLEARNKVVTVKDKSATELPPLPRKVEDDD